MSLLNILTIIMFTLKVLGKISVSWLIVFLPTIIKTLLLVIVFAIGYNYKE